MSKHLIIIISLSLFFCFLGCGLAGVSHSEFSLLDSEQFLKTNKPKSKSKSKLKSSSSSTVEKKVDILFVIDANPDLMDSHLKKVHQTFKNFIPTLNAVTSWKIAFTNADYNPEAFAYYRHELLAGKIMPLQQNNQVSSEYSLYSYSPHKEQIFLNTLNRSEKSNVSVNPCFLPPYCHSQAKNPVQSLIQAVSVNPNFFRRDSYATAVIFTNGDESTLGPDLQLLAEESSRSANGQLASTPQQVTSDGMTENGYYLAKALEVTFRKHYGPYRRLKVFSIAIVPNDRACLQQIFSERNNLPGALYAQKIYEVVRYTRGRMISICSSDYSALAQAIVKVE